MFRFSEDGELLPPCLDCQQKCATELQMLSCEEYLTYQLVTDDADRLYKPIRKKLYASSGQTHRTEAINFLKDRLRHVGFGKSSNKPKQSKGKVHSQSQVDSDSYGNESECVSSLNPSYCDPTFDIEMEDEVSSLQNEATPIRRTSGGINDEDVDHLWQKMVETCFTNRKGKIDKKEMRNLLCMRLFLGGMPQAEIAQYFGISIQSLHNMLDRKYKKFIKVCLGIDEAGGGGPFSSLLGFRKHFYMPFPSGTAFAIKYCTTKINSTKSMFFANYGYDIDNHK